MIPQLIPNDYLLKVYKEIKAVAPDVRNKQYSQRYAVFYSKRCMYIYDNHTTEVYCFHTTKYNVFCFDDENELFYAFEGIAKTLKRQRTLFCYHIPTGKLINMYEMDKNFFKCHEWFQMYYIDIFDKYRFLITYYYPIEDDLEFQLAIFDIRNNSVDLLPVIDDIKLDKDLVIEKKPYFNYNNMFYFDFVSTGGNHSLYKYHQNNICFVNDLRFRYNIFLPIDNNGLVYIGYDDEIKKFYIYNYKLKENAIIDVQTIDFNFRDIEYFKDIEASIYSYKNEKELYIYCHIPAKEKVKVYDLNFSSLKYEVCFSDKIWYAGVLGYREFAFYNSNIDEAIYSKKDLLNNYQISIITK